MKKIFTLSAIALVSVLFTSGVNAETVTPAAADAGKDFVIPDTNGGSTASLTMSSSPGVLLAAGTSSGSYILASMNVNTPDDKQLQYGIHNKYPGYYQSPAAAADTWNVTIAGGDDTTDLDDPFAGTEGWTSMGGSGS